MFGRAFIFTVLISLASVLSSGQSTITDIFDSKSNIWGKPSTGSIKVQNGQLGNKTPYGGYISLKEKNIGDFTVAFRLKFLKGAEQQRGHFSLSIDRGYGNWVLYFTTNADNSQITSKFTPEINAVKGAKAPFNEVIKLPMPIGKWLNVKIICGKSLYQLSIDDKNFILGTAPGIGGISFGSYRQPFVIDDLKLTYSKPERLSPNLQINGSFEYATNADIPDYWGGNGERFRTQGLPAELFTEAAIKDFHNKFYPDSNNAYHGKKSICVSQPFHLIGMAVKVVKNKNYVVSCYMKAENSGQKVCLGATADSIKKPVKEKVFELSKKWQRYEIAVPNYRYGAMSIFARPLSSGKVWVDAVQLEPGDKTTEFTPCWYDGGFVLPDDVNKNQCAGNTKAVEYNLRPKNIKENPAIDISELKLSSQKALNDLYQLSMRIKNKAGKAEKINVTVCVTAKSYQEQIKCYSKTVPTGADSKFDFDGLTIKDLRVCVNTILMDESGKIIKQTRQFIDIPQPMRLYPEWSFYTREKDARIVVDLAPGTQIPEDGKIKLESFVAGYMSYPRSKNIYQLKNTTDHQIFNIPVSRLKAGQTFIIRGTMLDRGGKKVMTAECKLIKLQPNQTEVKINRINRGVYVNGEPFLPYGILVRNLNPAQLAYYKKCGFDYIEFISHWNQMPTNLKFLKDCEKLKIKAVAFHVARPYAPSPSEAAEIYKSSPALVGIVPNDESGDLIVYERAINTKTAYPQILNCLNHHFHSYRMFANRIDGLPGDILSIDRYPFIMQPPGRPQTTNDIYSFERCLEMMDADGKRERKPVYCWLQAAERFAKEPTPQQLNWQTYIALVNHCTGFTYFGGIPNSNIVWQRMIDLNREVQALKPALFSLEPEPEVTGADSNTSQNIRILAKKLDSELTVICVSQSLEPVNAVIDLSRAGVADGQSAEVMFEKRNLTINGDKSIKDKFQPLERHVYKIKLK